MLARKQLERAAGGQVERRLPGLTRPTPGPGADTAAIGLDATGGGSGEVRSRVERSRRFEVTAIGIEHREAVVARAVVVHLLVLGAHGQHRVVGDVPLHHAVGYLALQRLPVDMALAVGGRGDETPAHVAALRQFAGQVQLGTVAVPGARLEG
ncbi:hypothetical protein WR25_00004 [Diploscapter pachys]|uniref:Uncharacterized protein n=1 Tax=Diploscapter pachys TaxID=2018661 RepID=A0A2A2KGW1_9BILA|nr:hypothetical protein WR25_00004 [Diploscapter pachys]